MKMTRLYGCQAVSKEAGENPAYDKTRRLRRRLEELIRIDIKILISRGENPGEIETCIHAMLATWRGEMQDM